MNSNNLKEKNENKKFAIARIFNSIKYSLEGLKYAYLNEQSLLLHAVTTIASVAVGLFLDLSFMEWSVIILASAVLLAVELLNTAVEAVVDMVTSEFNSYAKIAKDCGSAAAFVASLAFAGIVLYIFLPKIIELLGL